MINTSIGAVNVFVQGDLARRDHDPVFLSVHDLGNDCTQWAPLTTNDVMTEVMERSIWLHLEVPGQGKGAEDWPDTKPFPSLDELSVACVNVLDHFCIKYCVAIGQGVGANVLARMVMAEPSRCVGLIAINPTSTGAGIAEIFKDKWMGWKLRNVGHNPTVQQYLAFYHFGNKIDEADDKDKIVQHYVDSMKAFNPRNLEKFMNSFANRTALASHLKEKLTTETIVVTGAKYAILHTNLTFYEHCNPARTSLLKIDDCADAVSQAPAALAKSLILFAKGVGVLTSVGMPGVHRNSFSTSAEGRGRRPSMAEADKPATYVRRNSKNEKLDE